MMNRWGNSERLYFEGLQHHCRWWLTAVTKSISLLLERKATIYLDSILKSRDIILLTKVHLVKAMVFPVVMCGCESWTIKKAEGNAFELWCWKRFLRVPWTARRSNQPILKKSPEYSWKDWSWNSYTLATWCKELTHSERPWCWERLKEGGEGDYRGWDSWMASWTWWTWVWASSWSWWLTGKFGLLQSTGSQRVSHDWVTKLKIKKSFAEKRSQMLLMLAAYWLVKSSCSG